MKKNRMMRLAAVLLIAVLLTTSVISGTFAKYTTSTESQDSARVAKWGFEPVTMNITDLFANAYVMTDSSQFATNSVVGANSADVIAPGTFGSASFAFNYDETNGIGAPEVAYTFEVDAEVSATPVGQYADLDANENFYWTLTHKESATATTTTTETFQTVDQLIFAIEKLDGNAYGVANVVPNALPEAFNADGETYTIGWVWEFETAGDDDQDEFDTAMGNADVLDNLTISITITATQVD